MRNPEHRDSWKLLTALAAPRDDRPSVGAEFLTSLRDGAKGIRSPGFGCPSHTATGLLIRLREIGRPLEPKTRIMVELLQLGWTAHFDDEGIDFYGPIGVERHLFFPGVESEAAESRWLVGNPIGVIDADECPDLSERRTLARCCRGIGACIGFFVPEVATSTAIAAVAAAFKRAGKRAIIAARPAKERAAELVDRLAENNLLADSAWCDIADLSDLFRIADRAPPAAVQVWRDERRALYSKWADEVEAEEEAAERLRATLAADTRPHNPIGDDRVRRFLAYVARREPPDSRPEHPMVSCDQVYGFACDAVRFGLTEAEATPLIEQFAGQDVGPSRASLMRGAGRKYREALKVARFGERLMESDRGEAVNLGDIMASANPGEPMASTTAPAVQPASSDLYNVPGFVADVMAHTLKNAAYPSKALAFCGAFCLQSLLAGRKVKTPSGLRTNIYLLALASSGTGKEAPRKTNNEILAAADIHAALGRSFGSGEGLEDALLTTPAKLFQVDEFSTLLEAIGRSKDGSKEYLKKMLLELWKGAESSLPARSKAGQAGPTLWQPHLTIFGTATPTGYYAAISEESLTSGLLARTLVIEAETKRDGQDVEESDVDPAIIEVARFWNSCLPLDGKLKPSPRVVPITDSGRIVFNQCRQAADEQYNATTSEAAKTIFAREWEMAQKCALIYACSTEPEHTAIDEHAAAWAVRFVRHANQVLLSRIDDYVSVDEADARRLKVWRVIRAKGGTISKRDLSRATKMSKRQLDEAIDTLVMQDLVEQQESATGKRPSATVTAKAG